MKALAEDDTIAKAFSGDRNVSLPFERAKQQDREGNRKTGENRKRENSFPEKGAVSQKGMFV